ncbi:MAG: nuclear transport factor 2 family protein [Spirochaetales bacterium]|nr:nuclear transport factor 2 family protein [Leptospiraceae bacterium]MCP5480789.1 nuclear transport factor 2 family protein [Spirochaetales bacterium]
MKNEPATVAAVRQANQRFYRTFESLSLPRMRALWLETPTVKCVHPGWEPMIGFDEVMRSWERIFANTSYIEFEVAEEIIFVEGDLAVVSNPERLRSAGGGQSASGAVHATNVYLRYEGDWLMIVHHAS